MSGPEATPSGLVYDTGALIAAERNDRRMWAIHSRALARDILPTVPAGCVVEAWRGDRQVSLSRLLAGCEVEPLDDDAARRAGALLATSKRVLGPVDPTVVDVAQRRGAAVVTVDRDDLTALTRGVRGRLSIIDI